MVCASSFYVKEMNCLDCRRGRGEPCTFSPLSPSLGPLMPLHGAQVGNQQVKGSGVWKGKLLQGRENGAEFLKDCHVDDGAE